MVWSDERRSVGDRSKLPWGTLAYFGEIAITAMFGHIQWPGGMSSSLATYGCEGNAAPNPHVERDGTSGPSALVPPQCVARIYPANSAGEGFS